MSGETEWEAEVKIRRNGRLMRCEKALGNSALFALRGAVNDLERDLAHPEPEEEYDLTPEGYDDSPDQGVHQFDGGGAW